MESPNKEWLTSGHQDAKVRIVIGDNILDPDNFGAEYLELEIYADELRLFIEAALENGKEIFIGEMVSQPEASA